MGGGNANKKEGLMGETGKALDEMMQRKNLNFRAKFLNNKNKN